MDDLTARLNQILSDPESMNQIKNIAASLGLGESGATAPPSQNEPSVGGGNGAGSGTMPDLSALMGMLGGNANTPPPSSPTPPPLIDPATLGSLMNVFSKMNNTSNDKNIQLLTALKPHFSESRGGRVDNAIRILQLLSLLPILTESGLLSNLFGGDKK